MVRKSSLTKKTRSVNKRNKKKTVSASSEYVAVLGENAELVCRKAVSEVLFTRAFRSITGLAKHLSESEIIRISSAKTDGRVLLRLVSQPEIVTEIAPVSAEMDDEVARSMGPEIVSALSMLRGLQAKRELLEAAGGTLTSQQVASILGISRQAVHKKTKEHELLALSAGKRGYVYPAFQFTAEGTVIPGFGNFLKSINEDSWGTLIFLLEPDETLKNKTPIEALRKGHLQEVIDLARTYGEQGGH